MAEDRRAVYAILTRYGEWFVVHLVRGERYGPEWAGRRVWSDTRTTAFICEEGEEKRRVALVQYTGDDT